MTVRQNRYSVPVGLVGLRVGARIGASEIRILRDGRVVAVHERLAGRFGASAQLDHYLELLALKPGALARSMASLRRASAASGRAASTNSGRRSRHGSGAQRPRGRSSTSCCSAASTAPRGSSSRSAAPWRPARTTAARSRSWPAKPTGRRPRRSTSTRACAGSARRHPTIWPAMTSCARARRARDDRPSQPGDRGDRALIEAHAAELKLPTVRWRFREFAADTVREQQTPVGLPPR